MAQTHALITTLKKTLKAHGLTYARVAKALRLSEASVKRLFAGENFSLERLDHVCQLMGIEISDLVRSMDANSRRLTELTEEQEVELVSDTKLLLVAFLIVNSWTFDEILEYYKLSQTEAIRYFARLDKLRLIDLLPNNRIKLLISPRFTWRKNGPIQQFFSTHLLDEFFKNRFDQPGESLVVLSGMLSGTSSANLVKKIERLAAEFNELNQEDRQLPLEQRFAYGMTLALRPWRPDVFQRLRR